MQILTMTEHHIPEVTNLIEQLGYPNSAAEIQNRFQKISKVNTHALFVAKIESSVVGFIQVNIELPSLLLDSRAEIAALVVDQNFRSQGIGAALLKEAEKWIVKQNMTWVRLRSGIKRESAHRFYLREGYQLNKTGHTFTKDLG